MKTKGCILIAFGLLALIMAGFVYVTLLGGKIPDSVVDRWVEKIKDNSDNLMDLNSLQASLEYKQLLEDYPKDLVIIKKMLEAEVALMDKMDLKDKVSQEWNPVLRLVKEMLDEKSQEKVNQIKTEYDSLYVKAQRQELELQTDEILKYTKDEVPNCSASQDIAALIPSIRRDLETSDSRERLDYIVKTYRPKIWEYFHIMEEKGKLQNHYLSEEKAMEEKLYPWVLSDVWVSQTNEFWKMLNEARTLEDVETLRLGVGDYLVNAKVLEQLSAEERVERIKQDIANDWEKWIGGLKYSRPSEAFYVKLEKEGRFLDNLMAATTPSELDKAVSELGEVEGRIQEIVAEEQRFKRVESQIAKARSDIIQNQLLQPSSRFGDHFNQFLQNQQIQDLNDRLDSLTPRTVVPITVPVPGPLPLGGRF